MVKRLKKKLLLVLFQLLNAQLEQVQAILFLLELFHLSLELFQLSVGVGLTVSWCWANFQLMLAQLYHYKLKVDFFELVLVHLMTFLVGDGPTSGWNYSNPQKVSWSRSDSQKTLVLAQLSVGISPCSSWC